MPSSVPVSNDGAKYLISGSANGVTLGSNQYTFAGVPSYHPMRLISHGTG